MEAVSMEHGKVYVIKRQQRNAYFIRWLDPVTSKVITKNTGLKINEPKARAKADRQAAEIEGQLFTGNYAPPTKLDWAGFVERYNKEHLKFLANKSAQKALLVLDRTTNILHPKKPSAITSERLSVLASKLSDEGCTDSTIKSYLAHLRAALNWAAGIGLIAKTPKFPKIQRAARAHGSTPHKGRAITAEELDRMKDGCYRLFGSAKSNVWKQYLEALWLSGLRLEESFALSWDEGAAVQVVVSGKGRRQVARLLIDSEGQKNNETTLLPLAPDFSRWLLSTPEAKRVGRVFSFPGERNDQLLTGAEVGKKVSKLGKMAGVVVAQGKDKPTKFASAHDLRRSFGDRWADRVMPVVLRELMRHRSIETTLRFYVGKQAADIEATCRLAEQGIQQTENAESNQKVTDGVYGG